MSCFTGTWHLLCRTESDANPANFYPGTELTQTAADGIITSFPTFPGMSRLANLAVRLFTGLDDARHEVLSRRGDDFSAIGGSTKGALSLILLSGLFIAGKEPQLKYLYIKTGCMSPFHNSDKGLSVQREIKVKFGIK